MSSVREFGATGDGRTDDTKAIRHALTEGNGVLEFSSGTYRITEPIQIEMSTTGFTGIVGLGGASRVLMAGPGPAFRLIGHHEGTADPRSVKNHTWQRERCPQISGLEIVGAHPLADGIELIETMQTTITNVLIRQVRHGIHLVKRNRNFLLSASHIYDCHDTGVFFDRCNLHQVIINSSHISYCKRAGIRQLDGDVHNIQISGNDIEYNSGSDETSGEIVLEARDGVISEYTIASNTLQATHPARGANVLILGKKNVLILGKKEDPSTSVRLVNITGNVLGSRDQNLVVEYGSRVSITGNTIYGGQTLNVALRHSDHVVLGSNTILTRPSNWKSDTTDGILLEDCSGCMLQGNIINDCKQGDQESGGAVTIRNSRDIAVSGCQIFDSGIRGIDIHDSQRCRISDNSIIDRRDYPTMQAAVRVTGKSKGNVIQNNMVGLKGLGKILFEKDAATSLNNTTVV